MFAFTVTAKEILKKPKTIHTDIFLIELYGATEIPSYDHAEDRENYCAQMFAIGEKIKSYKPTLNWESFDTSIFNFTEKNYYQSCGRFYSDVKQQLEVLATLLSNPTIKLERKETVLNDLALHLEGCARGMSSKLTSLVGELKDPQCPEDFLIEFSWQVIRKIATQFQMQSTDHSLHDPIYYAHFESVVQAEAHALGLGAKPHEFHDEHLTSLKITDIDIAFIRLKLINELTCNKFLDYCKKILTEQMNLLSGVVPHDADSKPIIAQIYETFRRLLPDHTPEKDGVEPEMFMHFPDDHVLTGITNKYSTPKPVILIANTEAPTVTINSMCHTKLTAMLASQLKKLKLASSMTVDPKQIMTLQLSSPDTMLTDEHLLSAMLFDGVTLPFNQKQLASLVSTHAGLCTLINTPTLFEEFVAKGCFQDPAVIEGKIKLAGGDASILQLLTRILIPEHIDCFLKHENGIKAIAQYNDIATKIPMDKIYAATRSGLRLEANLGSSKIKTNAIAYLFLQSEPGSFNQRKYCAHLIQYARIDGALFAHFSASRILHAAFKFAINQRIEACRNDFISLLLTHDKGEQKEFINILTQTSYDAQVYVAACFLPLRKNSQQFAKEILPYLNPPFRTRFRQSDIFKGITDQAKRDIGMMPASPPKPATVVHKTRTELAFDKKRVRSAEDGAFEVRKR